MNDQKTESKSNRQPSPWWSALAVSLLIFSTYAVWNSIAHTYGSFLAIFGVGGGLMASSGNGHFSNYPNFYTDGDRQYLWASGPRDPQSSESRWFDLTGSPIPVNDFEFGIGKDTILAIDNPIFVKPDDPRLIAMWNIARFDQIEKMKVIGYAHHGEARAYPIRLMSRHELVNDVIGGKPVTVGW